MGNIFTPFFLFSWTSSGAVPAPGVIWAIIALVVINVVSMWVIYKKAGQPGWAAIIPIYNTIIWLRIVNKPWWWIFLLLIPIVSIIFAIIITYRLSKSFGYAAGFTVGFLLLPMIFAPILAFGKAQYKKLDGPAQPSGPASSPETPASPQPPETPVSPTPPQIPAV